VAETPVKPARKRASSAKTNGKRRSKITHDAIAERAYFIYVDEGCTDEVDNWLRAERELSA
jgi:hypothetical protein